MRAEPHALVTLHGDLLAGSGAESAAEVTRRVGDSASRILMEVARRAFEAVQGRTPSPEFRARLAQELQLAAAGNIALVQAPVAPARALRRRVVAAAAIAGGAAAAVTALFWWARRHTSRFFTSRA